MPGSPTTATSAPCPSLAACWAAEITASSRWRPTRGRVSRHLRTALHRCQRRAIARARRRFPPHLMTLAPPRGRSEKPMSNLEPDVIAAIQAIHSEDDYHKADERVKEALRTSGEAGGDAINELAAMLDDPPVEG